MKFISGECIMMVVIVIHNSKEGMNIFATCILQSRVMQQISRHILCHMSHQLTSFSNLFCDALKSAGTSDAISKMIRYEGFAGFYKGMGTKIVQSVFAAAVLFMVKEELVNAARLLVSGDLKLANISKLKPP